MRTIKFRGKTQDGEWVYGYYLPSIYEDVDIITVLEDFNLNQKNYAVLKETVGQFTGLTDKNGKEIYEGDIVYCEWEYLKSSEDNIFPSEEEWGIEKIISEVIWNQDDLQFEIKRTPGQIKLTPGNTMPLAYFSEAWKTDRGNDSITVIGNIHDNPELIKKEV